MKLAATDALPISKIRARIEKTAMQRAAVEEQLEFTVDRLQYTAESVLSFLALLVDPGTLYGRASDAVRRDLLTAYFNRLVVYVTDEGIEIEAERHDANARIREVHGRVADARQNAVSEQNKTPRSQEGSSVSVSNEASSFDQGLSNYNVAGVPGLEPRTIEPESTVLPITPYPTGV